MSLPLAQQRVVDPDTGLVTPPWYLFFNTLGGLVVGAGVPAATTGQNGNYYFRSDSPGGTTHIYFKAAGAWTAIL